MSNDSHAESAPHVAEINGRDVILWIGCSEEWATWAVNTANETSPGEAIQANVYLKEKGKWTVVQDALETIELQLGGESGPDLLLDHAPYNYKIGFSEEYARQLSDDLTTVLEAGVDGHVLKLNLAHSTLQTLVEQFRGQL